MYSVLSNDQAAVLSCPHPDSPVQPFMEVAEKPRGEELVEGELARDDVCDQFFGEVCFDRLFKVIDRCAGDGIVQQLADIREQRIEFIERERRFAVSGMERHCPCLRCATKRSTFSERTNVVGTVRRSREAD